MNDLWYCQLYNVLAVPSVCCPGGQNEHIINENMSFCKLPDCKLNTSLRLFIPSLAQQKGLRSTIVKANFPGLVLSARTLRCDLGSVNIERDMNFITFYMSQVL